MLARLAFCEMLSQYPQSAFQEVLRGSPGGSAAVCDPNPPRPFARSRESSEIRQTPFASDPSCPAAIQKNMLLQLQPKLMA